MQANAAPARATAMRRCFRVSRPRKPDTGLALAIITGVHTAFACHRRRSKVPGVACRQEAQGAVAGGHGRGAKRSPRGAAGSSARHREGLQQLRFMFSCCACKWAVLSARAASLQLKRLDASVLLCTFFERTLCTDMCRLIALADGDDDLTRGS